MPLGVYSVEDAIEPTVDRHAGLELRNDISTAGYKDRRVPGKVPDRDDPQTMLVPVGVVPVDQ